MHDTSLRGIWTYRSLSDRPQPVGSFDNIKVWEAELYLDLAEGSNTLHGHLGERPAEATTGSPYLSLVGTVSQGRPQRVQWRGVGAQNTAFEGWVYDYEGFVAPDWPSAEHQRKCIVGTVTRTVAHGSAPAGAVFSFIAVQRDFREPREVIPINSEALRMLASLEMRLHHQLWHLARNVWARIADTVKDAIRERGWQPGPTKAERHARDLGSRTNGSGEDFLYMHRRMIRDARRLDPELTAWDALPSVGPLASFADGFAETHVGNPGGFAVPPAWVIADNPALTQWLHEIHRPSSLYSPFRTWEQQFTNPAYLATLPLGELGSRLEITIHNWMHMRWASVPRDPCTGRMLPNGREDLDWRGGWVMPEYDYLGDTFSSHVNPVFWRLHGWIDDRIEDWYRAQQSVRPGAVTRRAVYGLDWFEADGTWVAVDDPWEGPRRQGAEESRLDLDAEVMKEALTILVTENPSPTGNGGARVSPLMLNPAYTGFGRVEDDGLP